MHCDRRCSGRSVGLYLCWGKRLLDLAAAIPTTLVLLPVMVLLALWVRFNLGSPVLSRQRRPGLFGKPFTLYKFRIMTESKDAVGNLLPDGERLTHLGCLLRSASLDELPELFNVLRGEMSLVGPRLLLMQYLDRYTPERMRRHNVKLGMTGWAQVSGRNTLTWEQKFALDTWYVDHVSFEVISESCSS